MASDVATSSSDVQASDEPAPEAPSPADPVLLGVPCAVIGVLALGLFLLGYAPTGSAGAVIPVFAALSVGLFIAARWAITAGSGPVAGIFGLFGGFYLSFVLLYVGYVHNWYGTYPPGTDDVTAGQALTDTFSIYALCWTIGIAVLVLGAIRLPLSVFLVLLFSDLVFLMVWLSFVTGTFASQGFLRTLAGLFCLLVVITGAYVFYASLSASLGGKQLPLGRAVRS